MNNNILIVSALLTLTGLVITPSAKQHIAKNKQDDQTEIKAKQYLIELKHSNELKIDSLKLITIQISNGKKLHR